MWAQWLITGIRGAKKDEKQPVKVESTEQQWIRNLLKACRVCRRSDVSAQRAVRCMVAVAMLTTWSSKLSPYCSCFIGRKAQGKDKSFSVWNRWELTSSSVSLLTLLQGLPDADKGVKKFKHWGVFRHVTLECKEVRKGFKRQADIWTQRQQNCRPFFFPQNLPVDHSLALYVPLQCLYSAHPA